MGGCNNYTSYQQVAFCVVGVGLALCIVGASSPNWLKGEVTVKDASVYLGHNLSEDGDRPPQTLDVIAGLWWYCISDAMDSGKVSCYSSGRKEYLRAGIPEHGPLITEDDPSFKFFIRSLMSFCLLIALVGLLTVCFYCCDCCRHGKTLGYGIAFFLAGSIGFSVVFILTFKVDVLLSVPLINSSFDWALPVFILGNALMILAALALCLLNPKPSGVQYETVLTAASLQPKELREQVGPYKPLPEMDSVTGKTDV